jgi:hypothetical protein
MTSSHLSSGRDRRAEIGERHHLGHLAAPPPCGRAAAHGNPASPPLLLEIQIIDDPSEQQNPLPDHDLLRRIADQTVGRVLNGATDLSAMIKRLPRVTGPPEVKKTPAWSVWSLLVLLLALLTLEWIWRRSIGLA